MVSNLMLSTDKIKDNLKIHNGFFFFFKILLMWTIFKVFIGIVIILLLFYVFGVLALRHVGSSVPQSEIKPIPPALEGEGLTTGPPKKSLKSRPFLSSCKR